MILTENANPLSENADMMSCAELVDLINDEDKKVALAVEKVKPAIVQAVECIEASLSQGGRLAYFGAGTSGRLGVLDASECFPTFSMPYERIVGVIAGGDAALRHSIENAEDNADFALQDIQKFAPNARDTVVGLSVSGNPAYVLTVLQEAQKAGAKTVGISGNPMARIREFCDVFINPLVGPEVVTGSSRMKAGTAQKMILNILSTAAMIRIGKTYKNYMIDLRPTNEKLQNRAQRIISDITGVSLPMASQYLQEAGGQVKTACVMASCHCNAEQANAKLAQERGVLRKVLEKENKNDLKMQSIQL